MMLSGLLLISALLSAVDGNGITAHAELDASEIPFHHVARYRVSAEGPAEAALVITPWTETFPGLEVSADAPVETPLGNGRKSVEVEFLLTPSIVNRYTLPETRVLVGGEVVAVVEARDFVVRALTPEEKADASVVAPLLSLDEITATGKFSWPVVLAWGFGIAAVGGVLWLTGWQIRRRGFHGGSASPGEVAARGLTVLEARLMSGGVSCEDFYLELNHLFRAYLCAGFDPAVAGQSTPEFVSDTLPGLPIPATRVDSIHELLKRFDRVLFAQHAPALESQVGDLCAVRELVTSLEQEAAARAALALQKAA